MTEKQATEIAEILGRRANDVASYLNENRKTIQGSVELALDREIRRLRDLESAVRPPSKDSDEEA